MIAKKQAVRETGARSVSVKRCLLRTIVANNQLLLFGGQTDGMPFLGDFWSLDLSSGTWTEQKPPLLPGPRNLYGSSFAQHAVAKQWTIYGGNTPEGPTGEVWTYQLPDEQWARAEQPEGDGAPPARYSTDIAGSRETFYMFGGQDGTSERDGTWTLELVAA